MNHIESDDRTPAEAPAGKRQYASPAIRTLGSVTALTAGSGGSKNDGGTFTHK
jgi:hypothetical protein